MGVHPIFFSFLTHHLFYQPILLFQIDMHLDTAKCFIDDTDGYKEAMWTDEYGLGIVPSKVRVAGFDDAKIAKLLNPPLTTIRQPVKCLAETAVASLLQRIRNPDLAPRAILLDAQMVDRRST